MNKFDSNYPLQSDINQAYGQVWDELRADILTLKKVRSRKKRISNLIRVAVFTAFAAGILIPLISALPIGDATLGTSGVAWGYLALSAGGLILLVDQMFGYSSGHARVRLAEMRLLGMLYDFESDWSAHFAVSPAPGEGNEHVRQAWDLIRQARSGAHAINQSQVEEWMAERERALALMSSKVPVPAAAIGGPPRPSATS